MKLLNQTCVTLLALALPVSSFGGVEPQVIAAEIPQVVNLPDTPLSPVPQFKTPVPFHQGEELQFAIKWGVVTGGHSSLKIQNVETLSGRPTYHIVAEARSTGMVDNFYKVNDRNEAWLEPHTPGTLRYTRKIHEGKYRVEEEVVLDQQAHRFQRQFYRIDKDRFDNKEGAIPPNVLDVLGSLYYLRTLALEVGQTHTIDVHSGHRVYPLVVKVKKRQTVKVKAGKFDCFVVEPQLREPGIFVVKGKKLEVFLTADERRMPVLMRSEIFIGHVSAELVSHKALPPAEPYVLSKGEVPSAGQPSAQ